MAICALVLLFFVCGFGLLVGCYSCARSSFDSLFQIHRQRSAVQRPCCKVPAWLQVTCDTCLVTRSAFHREKCDDFDFRVSTNMLVTACPQTQTALPLDFAPSPTTYPRLGAFEIVARWRHAPSPSPSPHPLRLTYPSPTPRVSLKFCCLSYTT